MYIDHTMPYKSIIVSVVPVIIENILSDWSITANISSLLIIQYVISDDLNIPRYYISLNKI